MAVTELLDELRDAYLNRGLEVDRHLEPALSRAEIVERTRPLGLTLPDDLIEMYEWRGGQGEDAEMSPDAFRFRDQKFASPAIALREYPLIQEFYAPEPDMIPYGFELAEGFPFAAYMGASHVVVCGEHSLPSPDPHPVVHIHHDVTLFFHSLETMLLTCIEWVRHPRWTDTYGLPDDIEHEIWRRHNPGAFER